MNLYISSGLKSIALGTSLAQKPDILEFLGNPQIGTESTAIPNALLYRLIELAKLAIKQENPILSDKLNGAKFEYLRFVSFAEDEPHYRTESQFVSDPDWSEKQHTISIGEASSLTKEKTIFIEKLTNWLSDGIYEIFPQFINCLGTQIDLFVELKSVSLNDDSDNDMGERARSSRRLSSSRPAEFSTAIPSSHRSRRCSYKRHLDKHLVGVNCKEGCNS